MKYNFDEIINRTSGDFSFSAKWQNPEYVLDTLDIKRENLDTICLETADMDYRVAPEILDDLHRLVDHGIFGYSIIPETYKQAVKNWYLKYQGWEFKEDDIFYFPGTHDAIANLIKKYTKENDGVIVLTPCYGYHGDVENNNRKYVCVDLINNNEDYTIDYIALEEACKKEENTALIMCHPHNPTGRVFNCDELKRVYEICQKYNVLIISDEVHSDIIRKEVNFVPMMKACGTKGIITCTAVNKTFNLAGLAMTNVIICDTDLKSLSTSFYNMPSPFGIQAVISAYTKCREWVDELNKYTDKSIEVCLKYIKENLNKVKVTRPEGGYSIYLDFSNYNLSDDEVTDKIYRKANVVLNSGLFFDDKRGKQVHRICLASPISVCLNALERIAKEFNK